MTRDFYISPVLSATGEVARLVARRSHLLAERTFAKGVAFPISCTPASAPRYPLSSRAADRRWMWSHSPGAVVPTVSKGCAVMSEGAVLRDQSEATPDTELLSRIAQGDVEAFAEFYDRHSTLLLSIAAKVLRDVHEAEEVLQDAARLIWESAPLYNPALGKPSSWAVVITRNKAIDRLRVLQRKSAAIARLTEEAEAAFARQRRETPGEAITRESGDLLRDALAALPSDQRLAIELAFFTGLSQTEVADQLGQPLGTIKARIRRGMLTMRDVLEQQL